MPSDALTYPLPRRRDREDWVAARLVLGALALLLVGALLVFIAYPVLTVLARSVAVTGGAGSPWRTSRPSSPRAISSAPCPTPSSWA